MTSLFVQTTNKFGVPTSGISSPNRGGILQPKYKYRFRVFVFSFGFPVAGATDLTQQVMTVGRPSIQYPPVSVHAYNSIEYYAGKQEWQTITLKVRDDITNSVSRMVGAQNQKQLNHFEQTGFAAGNNYKFSMLIETMDGSNDGVLEDWYLEGCFLSDINYGEFDYAAGTDFMDITMTVRYDNATQGGGLMPDPAIATGSTPLLA